MTILELLDIAIRHEVGSQELYRNLKDIVADPSTHTFLDELIREEENHEAILRDTIEKRHYHLAAVIENPDAIHEIRNSHSVYVTIAADSTIEDIMRLAVQREQRARILFERLAEHSVDEEQRLLFTSLAKEEATHEEVILQRYSLRAGAAGSAS
jgi:rubrerythrin